MYIKITELSNITVFVKQANTVKGNVFIRKGRYKINGKSLMSCFDLGLSNVVEVEYPEDAIEFENFIKIFEVKNKVVE